MEAFFTVLYWIGTVGMSLALAVTTVVIFLLGFKFIKDKRQGVGASFIAFSLVAGAMVVMMLNRTFFMAS